jgi:ribosomal protein S20
MEFCFISSAIKNVRVNKMYVVKSKVREYVKKKKMSFGGDAADALSKEVQRVVDRAIERAKANRRSTIKGRDV